MTVQDWLNADMATIGRELARALAWWRDQLASMLPAGWVGSGNKLRVWHRLDRSGAVLAATGGRADTLVLPAGHALVRDVVLPRLGNADLAGLIALEAERLLPLMPASVALAHRVLPRAGDDDLPADKLRVRIGALPLTRAEAVAGALAAAGLDVRRIGPLAPDGGSDQDQIGGDAALDCDFAPALRAAGLLAPRPPVARDWWLVVALLAALNLGVAVLADRQAVERTAALVDDQAPALTTVRKVEDRLRGDEALLATLAVRRASHQPLMLLATLDHALPSHAWIERLDWDGSALRLAGAAAPKDNVVAALKAAPGFVKVRASRSETLAASNSGKPWALTATTALAPAGGPR